MGREHHEEIIQASHGIHWVAALTAVAAPAAKAVAVAPDVAGKACVSPTQTNGLILYYQSGTHTPACFTGTAGTVPVEGDPAFTQYCAGSATGYLYIDGTKHAFTKSFHQLYGQHVSKVQFTGYNDDHITCGWIERS